MTDTQRPLDSDGDPIEPSEFGRIPGRLRSSFTSDRGRSEINPFVERIHELRPWVVIGEEAAANRGRWKEEIGVAPDAPLVLEIGPGNGLFFRDLSGVRPDAAFVGVEIRFKRVWLTAHKAIEAGRKNVRIVHQSFGYLDTYFAPNEVDEIYVNHPDPWPKGRHHKHRLLQPSFAALLASRLAPGGFVQVQSDFQPYGPLAKSVFSNEQWTPVAFTADLHGAPAEDVEASFLREGHILTNYERKKMKTGARILVGRWTRTSAPARQPTEAEEAAAITAAER